MASTPEEGRGSGGSGSSQGSGGSGKDDSHTLQQEEDNKQGGSGGPGNDDSSSEEYYSNIPSELSESEIKKVDSDMEFDSDCDSNCDSDDLVLGDDRFPITNALLEDDADALLALLPLTEDGKPDCNMPLPFYKSLLHRACLLGKINCAKALIRGGSDILVGENGPGIPFHFACSGYSLPLVEFMVRDARDKGEDTFNKMISATDFIGRTPLDCVSSSDLHSAIKKMVDTTAYPFSANEAQANPSKKPRTI